MAGTGRVVQRLESSHFNCMREKATSPGRSRQDMKESERIWCTWDQWCHLRSSTPPRTELYFNSVFSIYIYNCILFYSWLDNLKTSSLKTTGHEWPEFQHLQPNIKLRSFIKAQPRLTSECSRAFPGYSQRSIAWTPHLSVDVYFVSCNFIKILCDFINRWESDYSFALQNKNIPLQHFLNNCLIYFNRICIHLL